MRVLVLAGVLACVAAAPSALVAQAAVDELVAELAVARAGCVRCHAAPEAAASRTAPIGGPALGQAAGFHVADGGMEFLRRHHGGEAAAELAAWVRSLGGPAGRAHGTAVTPVMLERGERMFRELACQSCHAPGALESLAQRTDHARVAAFLAAPAAHRPGVVHDFALDDGESAALAAWLLRGQGSKMAEVAGFAWECFEVKINSATEPKLDGVQQKAQGVVPRIDVSVRTRDDHFALRFRTMLDVPATGEWTFTCGSDDGSWLWIDEQLVVENGSIAPYRRKSGTVRLTAGAHALRVVFTEALGGQNLEVLWRGPGLAEQEIPVERATATSVALVPPAAGPLPEVRDVQHGRLNAVKLRCGACHAIDDPAMQSLPAPAPARPWAELGQGECPQARGASAIRQAATLRSPTDAAGELTGALLRDGCLSCHGRDGRGGLQAPVRQGLTEVEDLGDEGRLPPDLTGVGHRLRSAWLEKVLVDGHKARPYVKVRMPKLDRQRAQRYAQLFAAVDGKPGDDDEPPFSIELAQLGQQLAGTTGRNCVTCHSFAGNRALGAQGMDLAFQHERLRPAWFAEFLLHPTKYRPGTRMLPMWIKGDANDRREVDALRTWLSLGAAAPLPPGIATGGRGFVLEPTDRPRLHGAFLKGLSARCIAVGTPERTHYAYDIEHARLAWLWRGGFLDAEGTWSGRAGKLLEPLGEDWLVLDDLGLGGDAKRTVKGQRMLTDGHPVFRVAVGDAEFEDAVRPRLAQGGSEVVRTLRCLQGLLAIDLVAAKKGKVRLLVGGAPAADQYTLNAGESLEVVYQW